MKQLRGKALKDFWRQMLQPEHELIFILQDVEDPANVGAAFRIGDACRVQEIILTGQSPEPTDERLGAFSRGMHRRIPWRYEKYASDAIEQLKSQHYVSYALEVTSQTEPYHEVNYTHKSCLVVGNEYHGVTRRTLAMCDMAVYIPMYGKIPSLNVHVALGVVAFHILHGT
ncbi:tRNA methyltransferase [Chloroflexi bacterium TSY]|nr:tRNA methyltransferase [Chloroflexi bacterium TSY]